MAQNDVLLMQNVHATLTEYTERFVAAARGSLITFNSSLVPTALPLGTTGQVLTSDGDDVYWNTPAAGHNAVTLSTALNSNLLSLTDQELGLDTQADNVVFAGPATGGPLAPTFRSLVANDIPSLTYSKISDFASGVAANETSHSDVVVDGDFTSQGVMLRGSSSGVYAIMTGSSAVDTIESTITDDDTHLPTSGAVVDYVSSALAAADAMIFKGTVGSGGTLTLAAHDALTTYNAGDTYKIIEASSDLWGKVVEIGDLIIAIVDRTGSGNLDSDWTVAQANIDGAVTGPASAVDNRIAQFNGISGKIIEDSGYLITDLVAKSLFDANTILKADSDNTPAALTVNENRVVGRITSGVITDLTGLQLLNSLIWSSAPASPSSTGSTGQVAYDGDYLYVCVGTDTWVRSAMATNWS